MSITESLATSSEQHEAQLASRSDWQDNVATARQTGEEPASNPIEPLTVSNLPDDTIKYDAVMKLIHDATSREEASALMEHIRSVERDARGDIPEIVGNPFLDSNIDKIPPLTDTRSIIIADPKVQAVINKRDISEAHQSLVEYWPLAKRIFTRGIKQGIETGYIPAAVEGRLEDTVNKTSVRVVDAAVLGVYLPNSGAYYRNDHDEIGVRHNIELLGEEFIDNLIHELTHKISGGTFVSHEQGGTEYHRPRVGYSTEMKPDDLSRSGLNEAVTEHIALGILNDDFETVDPTKRTDNDNTYKAYRKVLAEFIARAQGLISVKTITNAFFEDTAPGVDTRLRRKLIKEVRQSYGSGALTKLEKLMTIADENGGNSYEQLIFSRIHPPEVDEQGRVIKRGFIDTEGLS